MNTKSPILRLVLVLAALATALPPFLLLLWSLCNRWPAPDLWPRVWSLRAWRRLVFGPFSLGPILGRSLLFSLFLGFLLSLLAAMSARALCLYDLPGRRMLERLAMLPLAVPAVVLAMGSQLLFLRLGLHDSIIAVAIGHLLIGFPFALHVLLEASKLLGDRYEEEARNLGAGPFRAFLVGGLPSLLPSLFSAWALGFLFSYSQFFLTSLLGGGKVKTIALIVMPLIQGADRSISAAYSLVFIISSALVFAVLQGFSVFFARRLGQQAGVPL